MAKRIGKNHFLIFYKVKGQTSFVRSQNVTGEISLIKFTYHSTSSGDEIIGIFSVTGVLTGVSASNPANVNSLLKNGDHSSSRSQPLLILINHRIEIV